MKEASLMRTKVFTSVFVVMIGLCSFAAEPSPPEDSNDLSRPRFVSPDGRYGLLVTKDPESETGEDRVELIELATKRSLALLSDPEAPERSEKARLDWSEDSQRVAAFTGTRIDGWTAVYVRDGDGFVAVETPKWPELPNPEEPSAEFRKKHKFEFVKWIDAGTLRFVRWLKSGDVEMELSNEVAASGGKTFSAEITATVVIDGKHPAKLKNVVKKETLE